MEVVGISSDEDRGQLRELLAEEQIPWVTLHDNDTDGTHAIAEHFGIGFVPRAYLIDRVQSSRSTREVDGEPSC